MSFNNPKCSLSDFLMQKKQQISYEINNLNNDIIMANTAQDIVNNIQTKYMLEVIQISDSEIDRDMVTEGKIMIKNKNEVISELPFVLGGNHDE